MNIKRIASYFNKSYDLLNDGRIKFIYSVGGSIFILLFLFFFGPFGIVLFEDVIKFKLLSTICLASAVIIIIHIYLLQDFIIKKFTIGSTIIWLIWINFIVGLSNFIIYEVYFNHGHLVWKYLHKMLLQTYLVGILPAIFIIILYNTYYLRKKINIINQINIGLSKQQNEVREKTGITLTSENLKDVITVDSNSLLYLAAVGNYVEVHWIERGQVHKFLLRITLKELERKLKKQCQHFARCHNSYIININQVNSISGNSGGYRIMLNCIKPAIPVSRKYSDNILTLLKK
jgi:hypothetical protein